VGLGLVLARRIVEAHGGAIGFHSEPDAGSRFWFVLPRSDAAA
jgi:signal transduction histidine kinase